MNDMPGEPLTQLQEGAAQTHELFVSYVRAGFSETQAMVIVVAVIQACIQRGTQ